MGGRSVFRASATGTRLSWPDAGGGGYDTLDQSPGTPYEESAQGDGTKVLVDRVRPRGLTKVLADLLDS